MKSHPDAARRLAAEVVTQLPVPEHLGLLRFERLNEASWSMLYLDAACEAQLGVAPQDLCALLDAPYASLMEPAVRLRLHDDIQQQLRERQSYSVHYRLHTPKGTLQLLELGESFKQRELSMLCGYLRVMNDAPAAIRAPSPATGESKGTDAQQHLQRTQAQQALIAYLSRHRYDAQQPQREAAELVTRRACELYQVKRASIWHLNEQQLEPLSVYVHCSGRHESASPIDLGGYPAYLQALQSGRALDAHDALNDPRTRELRDDYLQPMGIGAMLDASIRVDGEVVGVLCLEHGGMRPWQADEIAFAGELADHYAQVLSNQQMRSATRALHLFQRAVEQSASAFILLDRDGLVEYVNPSFTAITLYSADEVQGRRLSDTPALENLSDILFDARAGLAKHNSWQGEFKNRRKNLDPYWGHLSLSKVHDDEGQLTHYIGIYEDITASKQAQQRIERLAFRDSLTGLGNRYAFIRALEQHFARKPALPASLLLVDIDNFKRINDSLGHQTGDKLLSALARRLRNSLKGQSTLARFASNEFAVLLEGKGVEDAQQTAQQLLQMLEKPLFVDNQLINVTGSIGLTCTPEHGQEPQILMKHAGLALHKAKANGKNQCQVFNTELNAEADNKLFVESNLRRALTQNELEVFYQPKLCLRSGRLLGMEALLRWHHPSKGMISPDSFISVAEETGLIIPIGKWVIRQACRMSQQLQAMGFEPLHMAINLSPKQFTDPDLVGEIAAILNEEQFDPALLELELTESLLMEASIDTRQQLEQLKALGLSLAMDDFGTGYSSLSYLKKFPIDVIKIDRSFIQDIPQDQDDMEITAAVIAMAHKLKLRVVAEGIETTAQLAFLRRQHCDIGQGYLFDRPIAGRELAVSLKRYRMRR